MIRRTLFLGLTLVLVMVLIALIIRSQKQEEPSAESLQKPETAPIRVFAPDDLVISSPRMELLPDQSALHHLQIQNKGNVTYSLIQLRFIYLDRNAKPVAVKSASVPITLKPGRSESAEGIRIQGVPGSASGQEVEVSYADMATD